MSDESFQPDESDEPFQPDEIGRLVRRRDELLNELRANADDLHRVELENVQGTAAAVITGPFGRVEERIRQALEGLEREYDGLRGLLEEYRAEVQAQRGDLAVLVARFEDFQRDLEAHQQREEAGAAKQTAELRALREQLREPGS